MYLDIVNKSFQNYYSYFMLRKALFLFALLFVLGVSSEARIRVKLTKAMYNDTYCMLDLCNVYATNIYGHPSVPAVSYADLADYEALVVEVAEGTPRFVFNRKNNDAQAPEGMISIPNDADQTEAYQTVEDLEDGKKAYIINLTKIKNDWNGVVHLNCIKSSSFYTGVAVTRMYLIKPILESDAEYTEADATTNGEILVTPRYKIGTKHLKLEDLASAKNGFVIRNNGRLLLTDDHITRVQGTEKTRIYPEYSDTDPFLNWRFKLTNDGVTDENLGINSSNRFVMHDAYNDDMALLGYACASPYAHVWVTKDEDEKHAREGNSYNYGNSHVINEHTDPNDGCDQTKNECANGTSWIIEDCGNGELTSLEQLRNSSGFYMISADEQNMSYFLPSNGNNANDGIVVNNVNAALDGSAYRYFNVEQMWGGQQYRIQAKDASGTYKGGEDNRYLNLGNQGVFHMGRSAGAGFNPETLADGTLVTILLDGKYLYGKNDQNTAMGTADEASAGGNAVWCFRLEKVTVQQDGQDVNGYLFRAVKPDRNDYSLWGNDVCYLNAQPAGRDDLTFILGLGQNNQYGQDVKNGAVWVFRDGGIMNLGAGTYFNGTTTSETPVRCSLFTLSGSNQYTTYDLQCDWGSDRDYGSLWTLGYEDGKGFTFRNNAWINGKAYYLAEDGNKSENPVYWRCFDPANFTYSDNQVLTTYKIRNVGVMQGNFNVNCRKWVELDGNYTGVWENGGEWDDNDQKGYVYEYDRTYEGENAEVVKARVGWRHKDGDVIQNWDFTEVVRTPESVREDKLIDDLVFALRHQIANEFNRYQCYDDAGQPSLTSNFEQEVKYALNYMYEDAQNCGGKNVYALADQLEYYNERLHLVKPKVGEFIRMQGEKNKTYFSGSSSKTTYDMLEEQVETVDGKEVVKDPGASTIFYYDAEGKLVNYSSGLVFGYADEGDYAVKTELKENTDKVVPTVLFTDSRVTRFPADRDKETGAILRDSVQVAHTYSVYMGPTENDKVLIAKKGTSAHVAHMGFPKPGDTGNYDSETEILLTKIVDLPISISPAGYATFCCPQDADLITEGARAYIGKVNDEMSKVTFINMPENGTRIPANTPVLIELKGGKTVYARVRTTGDPYTAASGAEQNSLVGKYYTVSYTKAEGDDSRMTYDGYLAEKEAINSHVYTLTGDGVWKFYTGTTLAGFKAKIKLRDIDEDTKQVKTFAFTFEDIEADDETSVQIAKELGVKSSDGVMYNLAGQRVVSPRKGVYVQDGKKVMVK